jgi:enamine deaminase RidA (YjgF/YER057c/UK114 family)
MIAHRLRELGITLPTPPSPAGSYRNVVVDAGMVYVSGHGPLDGDQMVTGKVGTDLTLEQGRAAARMTGLSILSSLKAELGDLDRIAQIVRIFGMVNIAADFDQMPSVVNGCSDLMVDVFGEAGRHARSAVGMAGLPFGIAVEIELTARLRP